MRSSLMLLLLIFLTTACSNSSKEQIEHLNGYWEIKMAEMPGGNKKEFPYSEIVDYIEVKEKEGIRKKVRPQLGGSFVVSEDQEEFTVKVENDSINLYYETPYSKWKETLLLSEDDEIKIINPRGIIYTYKRFTPYSNDYGQKN